ncbi:Noc2-domain-containing protein [Hortaea werneckii]|nr:Noc2-domain-containing protein [Hortaea werneckii]KAI6999507.1 Noc2-domain-containing protein [Hortaea werneckii]KAI7142911.1 Noc2-domain-containing protein [Hortaea werneckii]KAI7171766.1 Noc2-domain-containing protein [Hortaea werneckii]
MAQPKSQKKFEKKHLKDTLERRKGLRKVKQKQQLNAKRKVRRAEEQGRDPDDDVSAKPVQNGGDKKAGEDTMQNMSVDDFFQGGFEVPEMPAQKKRKRQQAQPEEEESESEESLAEEPVGGDGEDDSQESDDEDPEDHKAQLAALAEKDPQFHKYLTENEPELLGGELADIGDLSEDEEETPKRKKQKKGVQADSDVDESDDEEMQGAGKNELDKATVKKWHKALTEEHSMRAAREIVLAFRSAAHVSEDDEGKDFKYSISDPDVYHQLLTTALKNVPSVFEHHLPVQESKNGKLHIPTESKKFKTLAPVLKSHVTSVVHLLDNLSDAATIRLTLGSTLPLLPYMLSFKKLVRDVSRAAANVWSTSSSTEATRIAAFLVLRRLVVIGDAGIRENVLKATYQGLVKGSRNTTIHTLAGVNLMKNSAAELWGLASSDVAYTTAFTFIRQLAIHLRSAITHSSKEKEAYKTVYNWQYTHSLDFWSRVVSSHATTQTSPLHPLIYPLVQVTLGALRLIPTATYFPLRFHLLRSLLRISLTTSTYIPLAPSLHEVLLTTEMRKQPKPSTLPPLDFPTLIRAPKSYLRTRVYQDGVGEQVVELLSEFFLLWTKNIAFPELALPVIIQLRKWSKEVSSRQSGKGNKNPKLNNAVQLLVQKLEANARWIEERRGKVEFAPNDRKGVEGFLRDVSWEKSPLGAFVKGQRIQREEKSRVVEEGRREEERKREERRKAEKGEREREAEAGVLSAEEDDDEDEDDEEIGSEDDEEESDVDDVVVDGEGSDLEALEEDESDE